MVHQSTGVEWIIRGTKYWGKCVAQWQSYYLYVNGQKVSVGWEDKDTDRSKPYLPGCGGT
jgi:hypothetical protein